MTEQSVTSLFGPIPSAAPGPQVRNLSKARARILELLETHGASTVSYLADITGQHENTIREHLDALVSEDLALKYQNVEHSRGRPAWFYRTPTSSDRTHIGEYAGLAAALAGSIARTSSHPVEDAIEAGIAWSKDLVTVSRASKIREPGITKNAIKSRRSVVSLFEHLGFAPTHNADLNKIKLTRCPLLDAARQYPDIICSVHLGIVRGALGEFGATPTAVLKAELEPFAIKGACLLRM